MRRRIQDLGRRALLDHPATVHHDDPMRQVPHQQRVMRNEQKPDTQPVLQAYQQVDDLGPD